MLSNLPCRPSGAIDLHVFEDHENRPLCCQRKHIAEQSLEGRFLLHLGSQLQGRVTAAYVEGEQRGNQRCLGGDVVDRRAQQGLQSTAGARKS